MTKEEKKLLENILDGLDRLFDRESKAIDTFALIYSTSIALRDTEYFAILNNAAVSLEKLVLSRLGNEDERSEALSVTNDLRIFLARSLPF